MSDGTSTADPWLDDILDPHRFDPDRLLVRPTWWLERQIANRRRVRSGIANTWPELVDGLDRDVAALEAELERRAGHIQGGRPGRGDGVAPGKLPQRSDQAGDP